MKERVFQPIGVQNVGWDLQGGAGNIGPHANAHSGLRLSARDFARLGYLMAHRGLWAGKQIVPQWWIDLASKSSQQLNPSYGYTFWVNTDERPFPTARKIRSHSGAMLRIAATSCHPKIWSLSG